MSMGPPPRLEIHDSRVGGWLRLSLSGDLDSTGAHLLVRTLGEARTKHWDFQIEPDLPPQVRRLFRLPHLDQFILTPG